MRKIVLIIILTFLVPGAVYNQINQKKLNHSFDLPDGWIYGRDCDDKAGAYETFILENNDSLKFFLKLVPYYENDVYSDFPLMYIYTVSKKNTNCSTLQEYIKYKINESRNDFDKIKPLKIKIKTEDKREVFLYQYFSSINYFYVDAAFLELDDYYVILGLATRSKKENDQYFNDFIEFVKSYGGGYEKEEDSFIEDRDPDIDDIETAYNHNSLELLENILIKEAESYTEFNDFTLPDKPEIEREAYSIFQLFNEPGYYIPMPDIINDSIDGCLNRKYVIVNNTLKVQLIKEAKIKLDRCNRSRIEDKNTIYLNPVSEITINNFTPCVKYGNYTPIYLFEEKLKSIQDFIKCDFSHFSHYGPNKISDESLSRLKFLEKLIAPRLLNWGLAPQCDYWLPILEIRYFLRFEDSFNKACLFIGNGFGRTSFDFIKRNGKWEMEKPTD